MKINAFNRWLLASAAVLGAASPQAGFVVNPSFESNYNEDFPHYGPIDSWNGGSGVNEADGPFHNGGTPLPDGARVGFKQGSGDLSQDIAGLEAGKRYWIQFYYDARACCGGTIDLSTKINDTELDKIANIQPVTGGSPYKLRTVPFTADAETATLTFTAAAVGDATVNIDAVTVVQRDEGNLVVSNPSFEASGDVPDSGLLSPNPLAGWTANGQYGVNISGAGPSADNGTAPDQDHVAFLQGASSLSQVVKMVAGKPYQLSFAYNAHTGVSPHLQVKRGDTVLFEEDVSPVGGTAAYRTKTVSFNSVDVFETLTFAQTKDGDPTLLLDNVRLTGEIPPEIDPVSLTPDSVELGVGQQSDITISVPAEVLAVKGVDIVLQSTSGSVVSFVDASSALVARSVLHYSQNATNMQVVKVQGVGRGTATVQVFDAGGLPVRNQVTVTVGQALLKNPSFESTPVPAGVGYGAIAGWTGGSGLNSTGPFSDNGIIPDRSQVAFIQGAASLSQEVRGMVPGKTYWLQFYYNIRNCCPAGETKVDLSVKLGGKELASIPGITAVGEGAPYDFEHIAFVAESANAVLEFTTVPTGDATLLLDSISLVQRDPGQVVLRNPSFEASGGVFPFPGYFPSIGGWDVSGGGRGVNIDGAGPFTDNGSANAGDLVLFLQGGGAGVSQVLSGLTAGSKYIVGFLINSRNCCSSAEDSTYSVSVDDAPLLEEPVQPVGGSNPYLLKQSTFTAAGSDATLRLQNTTASGDHTILIDNVVIIPESGSAPFILLQPASVSVNTGDSTTLAVAAAGAGTLQYQWKKDGQALSGKTESTLVLDALSPAAAGEYTVDVSNGSGTASSLAAHLAILEPVPGVFDTGIGADGIVLADGATDPHYSLVQNPDSAQSTAALVEDSSAWPIASGPWFPNSDLSKWIGPRLNPGVEDPLSGPAGGDYVYRLSLDLTGFDAGTAVLSGNWGSDNSAELIVNAVPTGLTQSGFSALTAFSIGRAFKPGVNQVDFKVTNGDATGGPTGLRVEGLTAMGVKSSAVAPVSLSIARSGLTLRISWPASAPGVLESSTTLTGGWTPDPATVTTEAGSFVAIVNTDANAKYFRLRR